MVHETENRKQIEEQSKGAWILGQKHEPRQITKKKK